MNRSNEYTSVITCDQNAAATSTEIPSSVISLAIQCVRTIIIRVCFIKAAGISPITLTTKWRVYYDPVYLWKGIVLIFTAEVYIDSSRTAKGSLTTLSWCCITLLDIYYQFVAKSASVLDDYK